MNQSVVAFVPADLVADRLLPALLIALGVLVVLWGLAWGLDYGARWLSRTRGVRLPWRRRTSLDDAAVHAEAVRGIAALESYLRRRDAAT